MTEGLTRTRVVIEAVKPEIDAGRFPIKRTVGEKVIVEADAFTDGHDLIACVLRYRKETSRDWLEVPMTALVNDRWRGEFCVAELGRYHYSLAGWIDHFQTWSHDLGKRLDAGQDVAVELLVGANLIEEASARAPRDDAARLRHWAASARRPRNAVAASVETELALLMARHPDRRFETVRP